MARQVAAARNATRNERFARARAAGERAATAPDCPNPSRQMYEGAARWRYGCDCKSCTERKGRSKRRGSPGRPGPQYLYQDVDDIAVQAVLSGHHMKLNLAERLVVCEKLDKYGLTARQVADRLRVTPRTIERYRSIRRNS